MAPSLTERAYCAYYSNGICYEGSAWYWWGRWVFAGVVFLVFLICLILLARNSRRRRRQGLQPLRGTGWMAPAPPYYPPPPQYSAQGPVYPQPTGQKFDANQGYYGQQEGINLQQPAQTYQPAGTYQSAAPYPSPPPNAYPQGNDYAPPDGPPPAKRN